jgi:hypothetical protein
MTADPWRTAVVAVDTPRGLRWKGVSYTGRDGVTPWRVGLPGGAVVVRETRLRVSALEAGEMARSWTIHHNLSLPD